jgi:hypothetical protein
MREEMRYATVGEAQTTLREVLFGVAVGVNVIDNDFEEGEIRGDSSSGGWMLTTKHRGSR